MRILIAVLFLFVACTPRQIVQQVPERVVMKYLPAETASIIDSTSVSSVVVHDTTKNTDTVIVTKTRWRETVKEKRVIDTIPQYIVKKDTVRVEKKIPVAPWKWWIVGALGFLFGSAMVFSVTRVFK